MVGYSCGSVIRQKICQALAPSISAASAFLLRGSFFFLRLSFSCPIFSCFSHLFRPAFRSSLPARSLRLFFPGQRGSYFSVSAPRHLSASFAPFFRAPQTQCLSFLFPQKNSAKAISFFKKTKRRDLSADGRTSLTLSFSERGF